MASEALWGAYWLPMNIAADAANFNQKAVFLVNFAQLIHT